MWYLLLKLCQLIREFYYILNKIILKDYLLNFKFQW